MKCNYYKELALGRKVESEHAHLFPKSMRAKMIESIAKDHIRESPCYYSKGLIPLERKLKGK